MVRPSTALHVEKFVKFGIFFHGAERSMPLNTQISQMRWLGGRLVCAEVGLISDNRPPKMREYYILFLGFGRRIVQDFGGFFHQI
jgi:hypothetical protein